MKKRDAMNQLLIENDYYNEIKEYLKFDQSSDE